PASDLEMQWPGRCVRPNGVSCCPPGYQVNPPRQNPCSLSSQTTVGRSMTSAIIILNWQNNWRKFYINSWRSRIADHFDPSIEGGHEPWATSRLLSSNCEQGVLRAKEDLAIRDGRSRHADISHPVNRKQLKVGAGLDDSNVAFFAGEIELVVGSYR